jgi:uncharacterized membrane protein (UPF0136 family)
MNPPASSRWEFSYHTGKSWILSLLTGTAVGLNAFFTGYFLRTFGRIGAAYAPVLAWGVTLILSAAAALKLWTGVQIREEFKFRGS